MHIIVCMKIHNIEYAYVQGVGMYKENTHSGTHVLYIHRAIHKTWCLCLHKIQYTWFTFIVLIHVLFEQPRLIHTTRPVEPITSDNQDSSLRY